MQQQPSAQQVLDSIQNELQIAYAEYYKTKRQSEAYERRIENLQNQLGAVQIGANLVQEKQAEAQKEPEATPE